MNYFSGSPKVWSKVIDVVNKSNYILDSIILNSSNFNNNINLLLKKKHKIISINTKKMTGVNLPIEILIYSDLRERIIHWKTKSPKLSEKYFILSDFIIHKLPEINDK